MEAIPVSRTTGDGGGQLELEPAPIAIRLDIDIESVTAGLLDASTALWMRRARNRKRP